ncbi:MAG: hypothetical protein GF329_08610 [Candidatus Lokiarchaeota archaeon]|nr:hypothetical protein [Candidatus Lokiarchaeota archaeon]
MDKDSGQELDNQKEDQINIKFNQGSNLRNKQIEIQDYLEQNEKVKFFFKPLINYKKRKRMLLIALTGFIISFIIFSFSMLAEKYFMIIILLIALFSTFISVALCTFFGITATSFRIYHNSEFIFTNKKIIWKLKNKICIIKYSNIDSIKKLRSKREFHNIILNFKKRLDCNPFIPKNMMQIIRIPNEFNLIDKINNFRK